mgnify:CR=1 FL=1
MKKITFGTSGWRGIIADDYTFDNLRIVSQAVAEYIKEKEDPEKGVIVTRDTRFLTEKFVRVVAEVLTGNGIKVLMTEKPTPTPVVSYTIRKQKLAGGINLTASHNPPEYCGFKFNPSDGGPALPEVTSFIESKIAEIQSGNLKVKKMDMMAATREGLFELIDPSKEYLEGLKKLVDFERIKELGIKVAADLLYGTAIGYLDVICRSVASECLIVHDYRDPYFGGGRPEPDQKRMSYLGNLVMEKNLDVGLAVDGDADRFGIVDEKGNYVKPNEVIALLAWHLYKNKGKKGPSARSVATSKALDAVVSSFGENVIETPVGFKYLGNLILTQNVVIAGEESGGLSVQDHIPEKDGILACLLMLEMIAYEKKKLSDIRKEFEENFGKFHNARIDLEFRDESEKKSVMRKFEDIEDDFAGLKITSVDRTDGMKFFFGEDTWMLIRPSGTEPVVRIYVESVDEEKFRNLMEEVRKFAR